MPKLVAPESVETVSETSVKSVSRKREITAVVTAAAVTAVLGMAATGVIDKVARTVRDRIAPPKTESETTEDE